MGRWKTLAIPPSAELSGMRFGQLGVVMEAKPKGWHRRWVVLCDCGTTKIMYGVTLRAGDAQSCGCMSMAKRLATNTKHGLARSREYNIWRGLIRRCYKNSTGRGTANYRERGITVCDRWRGERGFINFIADMGKAPTKSHTIERKNNDGEYSPRNCCWATRKEQAYNRRTNHRITFNGETLTITEWANRVGISPPGLYRRLEAWTVEKALTTPCRK